MVSSRAQITPYELRKPINPAGPNANRTAATRGLPATPVRVAGLIGSEACPRTSRSLTSPGRRSEPPLDAAHVGGDQLRFGPVAQHQRRRPGAVVPAQPQHRVGEHGRAAPARAAVDEHSRLRLILQHPHGEARRRRPHLRPLPPAVILHRRVRDLPGAESRLLGRQVPVAPHLRPRPAVDHVRHALPGQAGHRPDRRHAADRDALIPDPAQRRTGNIWPRRPARTRSACAHAPQYLHASPSGITVIQPCRPLRGTGGQDKCPQRARSHTA